MVKNYAKGILMFVVILLSACSNSKPTLSSADRATPSPYLTTVATARIISTKPPATPALKNEQGKSTEEGGVQSTVETKAVNQGLALVVSQEAQKEAEKVLPKKVADAKQEIYFLTGFGGGGGTEECYIPKNAKLPTIGWAGYSLGEKFELCVLGLEASRYEITIYSPGGEIAGTKTFDQNSMSDYIVDKIDEGTQYTQYLLEFDSSYSNGEKNHSKYHVFSIYLPKAGTPLGDWRVSIDTGKSVIEGIFQYERSEPAITISPDLQFDPFQVEHNDMFAPGDTVYVVGSGYKPGEKVKVGFYEGGTTKRRFDDGGEVLVNLLLHSIDVVASSEGDFVIPYKIGTNYSGSGIYVFANPDMIIKPLFPYGNTVIPVSSLSSSSSFNQVLGSVDHPKKICQDAPSTQLSSGDHATVSFKPPNANTVRERPGKKQRKVGLIQPGEEVEIYGGPVCADGWVWWEVRSLKTGLSGYTAEGDFEHYWLIPVSQ